MLYRFPERGLEYEEYGPTFSSQPGSPLRHIDVFIGGREASLSTGLGFTKTLLPPGIVKVFVPRDREKDRVVFPVLHVRYRPMSSTVNWALWERWKEVARVTGFSNCSYPRERDRKPTRIGYPSTRSSRLPSSSNSRHK